MAGGIRNNLLTRSAARIRLERDGRLTIETDMTDIGTGSYTILAQTAAEMMGVPLQQVTVKLGDSDFPASSGSGGQWGANNSTAGLYAACVKLRGEIAQKLGFNADDARFAGGTVTAGNRSARLSNAAKDGPITAEDAIEYGDLAKRYQQSTFAAHFVEVAVDGYTGETRVRRMLAVCDAGRILNPISARSQVIGAMTMGVGAALMEELAVDKRFGFFVNHDLASYEVPTHADIPHQDVIFLDHPDDKSSPMKAKGVGELGLCGVGAAIANAIYNATGVRVRDYPITLDKHLAKLPGDRLTAGRSGGIVRPRRRPTRRAPNGLGQRREGGAIAALHPNAQRSVRATPIVPPRTSERRRPGSGKPCMARAQGGSRSMAASVSSFWKGATSGLTARWPSTSRATSRVRASARSWGRMAAISASASAREPGRGSAPSARPTRATSAKYLSRSAAGIAGSA